MFTNVTSTVSSWIPTSLRKGDEVKKEDAEEESSVKATAADDIRPTATETIPDKSVIESTTEDSRPLETASVPTEELKEGGDASTTEQGAAALQAGIEGVQGAATNAYQSINQSAKTFGSFLFNVANKAGKSVTDTAKQLKSTVEENSFLGEFNREQAEFANQQSANPEAAIPPWVGYPEEDILKQQIIGLSSDRRNFVRSPPTGVDFQFVYDNMYPVALATLKEDPELEKMRFELVPKVVNEETFWKNYFYRVSLIKQSTQLSSLAQEQGSGAEDSSPDESPKDEPWERELQQELQEYEVVNDQPPTADDTDWEKEVQQMLDGQA